MVRPLVEACLQVGVSCLTLFAFSTENWRRPPDEVSTLMGLFLQYLEKELDSMASAGVRLQVIGDSSAFPSELRQRIQHAQARTAHNRQLTLVVAANYGGQWDVVQAAQRWMAAHPQRPHGELTVAGLAEHLSTAELPELDLLIRTGGEQRISNFLLWQAAYAELYFTDVLWPEFDVGQFERAMEWFAGRERRFGRVQADKMSAVK